MGFLIISVFLIFGVYLVTILPIFVFKKYFSIELSEKQIFCFSLFLGFIFSLIFSENITFFLAHFFVDLAFLFKLLSYFGVVYIFIFLIYLYFFLKKSKISFKKFLFFFVLKFFSGILIGFLYFGFFETFFKPHYDYQNKKIIFATKIYKNLEVGDKIVFRNSHSKFHFTKKFEKIEKIENEKIFISGEDYGKKFEKEKILEKKEILGKVILEIGI